MTTTVNGTTGITFPDGTTLSSAMFFRSYLAGLVLSTAGSSTTMAIAAGVAADSTNATMISLAAAISKTTSAWAVGTGNGGLDTGTIANSTWYHFYLIRRPDTGVVDVIFSLSASAPTLPANYTQYRRIATRKTNGSAQWASFIQDGDFFQELTTVLDVNATNPGTSAVTRTLSVPTGINALAVMNINIAIGSQGSAVYLSDLAVTDEIASITATPLGQANASVANANFSGTAIVRTNTSAQIRSRNNLSDASTILRIATLGYYDRRGRDA